MAGDMTDADILSLLKSSLKCDNSEIKAREGLNLQEVTDENVLIWLEKEKEIIVFPKTVIQGLKNEGIIEKSSEKEINFIFQKLTCSQPITFEVVSLKISFSGQFLALVGLNGVAVLEMPRQWGKTSLFVGGKPNVICRTVMIGDYLFRQQINLQILHLEWFPGSQTDSHIVLLTNDDCLRCFDVGDGNHVLSTINLSNSHKPSKSHRNFALAYGEVAVSFSIAPPVSGRNEITMYPIFVLQENGDVLIVWSWLHKKRVYWVQKGPLKMTPESEDNYGGNFCSILCLKTTPTIVLLATENGIIHHCIVLDDDDKQLDFEVENAREDDPTARVMVLYVYDSCELEKTLVKSNEDRVNQQNMNNTTLLVEDRTNANCYFSINSGGVHLINLPWIDDLTELTLSPNEELELKSPSEIVFLVCTQPTENSQACGVFGLSSFEYNHHGTVVACLLENGEIVTRITNSKSYEIDDSIDFSEDQKPNISRQYPSPLKRLQFAGTFDEYIKKILKRNTNTPIIKSDVGADGLSHAEFYQLLSKATYCMREEYIKKLTKAKLEIKKRCEVLEKHKIQQLKALNEMIEDRIFSDNAEVMADKLSTVSERMQTFTERLDSAIHFVQSKSPALSDAELDWKKEIETMQSKLMHLKRNMERLKQKDENFRLSKVRMKASKSDESHLNSVQLLKVKANLKDQNNRIAELVEKLKSMDKQI